MNKIKCFLGFHKYCIFPESFTTMELKMDEWIPPHTFYMHCYCCHNCKKVKWEQK